MAKYLGMDKLQNLLKAIKQSGGFLKALGVLYRTEELKFGKLVGEDKFGNKYYENNMYYLGRNRWVHYNPNFNMNYEGSFVDAKWFGWLHYKTDYLPNKDPTKPKHKWMEEHVVNLTGTKEAFMPYSTTKPKIEAWKPKD